MLFSLGVALQLSAFAFAAPTAPGQTVADAPFTISNETMVSAITCPRGVSGSKELVLLVHGLGSTGAETWEATPYNTGLAEKGYDVCWVDLPDLALADTQLSAEYVAFGVQHLSQKNTNGAVAVIGYGSGSGMTTQWALTFWPSIQPLVSNFVGLASGFQGTQVGVPLLCNAMDGDACVPAVWQQTTGSQYLAAQNSLNPGGGGRAIVPTTSIYTFMDLLVVPELPPLGPASGLPEASVHALQDEDVCGPMHTADHASMLVDQAAFTLALLALGGPIDISKFDKSSCTVPEDNLLLNPMGLADAISTETANVNTVKSAEGVHQEPALKAYVCERGFAATCGVPGAAILPPALSGVRA